MVQCGVSHISDFICNIIIINNNVRMQVIDTISITFIWSIPVRNNQLNDQMRHIKWVNETQQTDAVGIKT